jgi:hypothetical protein
VSGDKPAWLLPHNEQQLQVAAFQATSSGYSHDAAHANGHQQQHQQMLGLASSAKVWSQSTAEQEPEPPVAGLAVGSAHRTRADANQQQQQQTLETACPSHRSVQLLQQVGLVRSWSAAHCLLLQHAAELQQAHIGLLWWQLLPKLRQQQQRQQRQQQLPWAARQAGGSKHRLQQHGLDGNIIQQQAEQQQQVLQCLCKVTEQQVSSLTPQSLAYTMQGLAAAVSAGAVTRSDEQQQQQQQQVPGPQLEKGRPASMNHTVVASAAAVQLLPELPLLLWARLQAVAGCCTARQLAHCLEAGQLLGWQLAKQHSSSSSNSGDSSSTGLCCWPVLEQASAGLLGSGLLLPSQQQQQQQQEQQQQEEHRLLWSSQEAGQLLHALAGYVKQQRLQAAKLPVPPQQQQSQQLLPRAQAQHPLVPGSTMHSMLQCLVDQACDWPAQSAFGSSLGQGVTHVHTAHSRKLDTADADASADAGSSSSNSELQSACSAISEADLSAVICSLQAAALLQLLPGPTRLEALLAELEPQLQAVPARQLLQLLQACTDLGVEPWDSWLCSCYASLEVGLQRLQPQELLQLLQLLPHVSRLQPSGELLAGLAKMMAVHAGRCSWRQLAALPLSLAAVGYRPEPYWLKDYVAASSAHMARQQQQQQQQQQQTLWRAQQRVQLLVDMLLGVAWLSAASRSPPSAWVAQVEQQLLAALTAVQRVPGISVRNLPSGAAAVAGYALGLQQQQQQQQQQRPLLAETAAVVLAAFQQLHHTPSEELQQLLSHSSVGTGLSSVSKTCSVLSSSSSSSSSD